MRRLKSIQYNIDFKSFYADVMALGGLSIPPYTTQYQTTSRGIKRLAIFTIFYLCDMLSDYNRLINKRMCLEEFIYLSDLRLLAYAIKHLSRLPDYRFLKKYIL